VDSSGISNRLLGSANHNYFDVPLSVLEQPRIPEIEEEESEGY
jgi:hypothetical protein